MRQWKKQSNSTQNLSGVATRAAASRASEKNVDLMLSHLACLGIIPVPADDSPDPFLGLVGSSSSREMAPPMMMIYLLHHEKKKQQTNQCE
jgi:hypothetical protein